MSGSAAWKAGPGGTISETVTSAKTISGTFSVSVGDKADVSLGVLTDEAKIDISASVTGSTTVTTGHTYSHNITSNKYGNLQYGSYGYKFSWKKWVTSGSCTTTTQASGTAILPTTTTGWKYWETSS
ncbi:hypothetical protein [Streptantibioticus silvisoli]|uniref:Uncharacterized protein n=1 Tax=Streptantibioticus silvisoli TaxID=2705255 RepID=A0ABT6W9Z9_9ACTN|nr:hypothetical protein [Streptantibioticus silvisoli]MDI5966842.1 hypothetical protein [Streptantibioticus silvisoli]